MRLSINYYFNKLDFVDDNLIKVYPYMIKRQSNARTIINFKNNIMSFKLTHLKI